MKQVNVRLNEELIKSVKQYALDNDMTFQDVVKEALEELVSGKVTVFTRYIPIENDKNC